jgi:hypothetical protein
MELVVVIHTNLKNRSIFVKSKNVTRNRKNKLSLSKAKIRETTVSPCGKNGYDEI